MQQKILTFGISQRQPSAVEKLLKIRAKFKINHMQSQKHAISLVKQLNWHNFWLKIIGFLPENIEYVRSLPNLKKNLLVRTICRLLAALLNVSAAACLVFWILFTPEMTHVSFNRVLENIQMFMFSFCILATTNCFTEGRYRHLAG